VTIEPPSPRACAGARRGGQKIAERFVAIVTSHISSVVFDERPDIWIAALL